MRHYLDYYWDIYWELHLGVKGAAIPPQVRTIGESFNTVLAFRDPTKPIVYNNYMTVRALLDFLKSWIDGRLDDIAQSRIAHPEQTIAWYWLKNAGDGTHFSKKDVVFECFHNFVAFSQWGNTMFGIMSRLSEDGGNPNVRAAFEKTMSGNPDAANGAPYTPIEMFVMELFRTISPNGGSISTISDMRLSGSSNTYGDSLSPLVRFDLPFERNGYIISPAHLDQLRSPALDESKSIRPGALPYRADQRPGGQGAKQADRLCQMPLRPDQDGGQRRPQRGNGQQRLRHGVRRGRWQAAAGLRLRRVRAVRLWLSPLPPASTSPSRCSRTFLRKVWRDKIAFRSLNLPNPRQVPIGPGTVIDDNITFVRSA